MTKISLSIRGRFAALLLAALASSGCDPEEKFVIRSVDAAGKRVGGVKLERFCPGRLWLSDSVKPLGTTNEDGIFRHEGVGTTAKGCIVRAVGRVNGVLVEDVCVRKDLLLRSCLAFEAVVSVGKR